jgi:hypothetical protein
VTDVGMSARIAGCRNCCSNFAYPKQNLGDLELHLLVTSTNRGSNQHAFQPEDFGYVVFFVCEAHLAKESSLVP